MDRRRTYCQSGLAVAALVTGLLLVGGCSNGTSPEATFDSNVSLVTTQEESDMGAVAGNAMASQGAAKSLASADTIYVQDTIQRWGYDAAIQGWVREATWTALGGLHRVRLDTLYFRDSAGALQAAPSLATTRSVEHIRHTTRTKGSDTANVRLHILTNVTVAPGDTHVVRNGSVSGTIDDLVFASDTADTIMNVTRAYSAGSWHFPESGTIKLDFPEFQYTVVYTGGGTATVTITNVRRNRTWVIDVTLTS